MKKPWSPDELETLHSMLAEKKTPKEIAKVLGCPRHRVDGRIRHERMPPDQRAVEAKKKAEWDRENRASVRAYRDMTISYNRPTQKMIDDAKRRADVPRSLTASFFNDPPRGYSALDRKQNA